jgi:DNA-binding LacI/PurR family transcriptional regulator
MTRVEQRARELTRAGRYPTIKDVAQLSNVSTATVARVLQASNLVTPKTTRRVLRAVSALGYEPDHRARALVSGRTNTLGLLVPSLRAQYWGEVAEGIEREASGKGWYLLVSSSQRSAERERAMLQSFRSSRADAVIVGGFFEEASWWADVGRRKGRTILMDWDKLLRGDIYELPTRLLSKELQDVAVLPPLGDNVYYLCFDEDQAGSLVMDHLADLGHQRVAFVGPTARTIVLYYQGLLKAAARRGFAELRPYPCDDSLEGGLAVGGALLAGSQPPTAFVAATDVIAFGILRAAAIAGVEIPTDVSLVGHDDLRTADFVTPALTTVRTPRDQVGQIAVDLALGLELALPTEGLPVSLIVRNTTAMSRETPSH